MKKTVLITLSTIEPFIVEDGSPTLRYDHYHNMDIADIREHVISSLSDEKVKSIFIDNLHDTK